MQVNRDPLHSTADTLHSLSDAKSPIRCEDYTSSTHKHYLCNACLRRFFKKNKIIAHLKLCEKQQKLSCEICNLNFVNKGSLAHHTMSAHCDNKYNRKYKRLPCDVCDVDFRDQRSLTYHIRKSHFNLSQEAYTYSMKPINETWVERIRNTEILVEMKKINRNLIVIKKVDESMAELVEEPDRIYKPHILELYPIKYQSQLVKAQCQFCHRWMLKKSLKMHVNERHWNVKKYECKSCQFKCTRPYQLLNHVCGQLRKKRRPRGVML